MTAAAHTGDPPLATLPTDTPAAWLRRFIGCQLADVGEIDGVLVLTFRPVGRRSRRHVSIAGDRLRVGEVREGCALLARIEAARFDGQGGAA